MTLAKIALNCATWRLRRRMRRAPIEITIVPPSVIDNTSDDDYRLTWPEVLAAAVGFGGYLFLLVQSL